MTAALHVKTDGTVTPVDVPKDGLSVLQGLVSGRIDVVSCHGFDMIINDEGKYDTPTPNTACTVFARVTGSLFLNDYIAGDVVLVGKPDREGEHTDLHPEVVALFSVPKVEL